MMRNTKQPRILLIQGANMCFLGRRQPEIYGTTSASELDEMLQAECGRRQVDLEIFYTNVEGEAISRIYRAVDEGVDGVLMNPAGFQYAGFALRDCLLAAPIPYVEAHITKASITGGLNTVTAAAARGYVCGFGIDSYLLALDGLLRIVQGARAKVQA
jgi:3-dehydroquinate dehydratase-2